MLRLIVMSNEADRDKRQRLEHARNALTEEHLLPLQLDAIGTSSSAAVRELGAPNYAELHRRLGFQLDELAERARAFLDADRADVRARRPTGSSATRVGVGARGGAALGRGAALPRARVGFGLPRQTGCSPRSRRRSPTSASTSTAQENVELDVEKREKKTPRAFCAPIEVPQRVVLVIQPIGGVDDWRALFHEAGHTEHYAHTNADLAVEERRLGDYAVTEGWAMLMEHLVQDAAWLNRRLDVPRPPRVRRRGRDRRCSTSSAATARSCSTRSSCTRPRTPSRCRKRYVELLADALKIEPSETDYLADVDAGFYVTEYVRAWAFEAQLERFFREKFGSTWFARRDAGSLLRELWAEGQRLTADELLKELTSAEIELEAVSEHVRDALAGA